MTLQTERTVDGVLAELFFFFFKGDGTGHGHISLTHFIPAHLLQTSGSRHGIRGPMVWSRWGRTGRLGCVGYDRVDVFACALCGQQRVYHQERNTEIHVHVVPEC